jgi:acetoin utilization deacetylase AcuC-like enzyme
LGTSEAIYLETLDLALTELLKYSIGYLFLSARMYIYESDPLGKINISRMGIAEVRRRIAALHIPIVIVLEGGYNNEVLGEIVVALLDPFAN